MFSLSRPRFVAHLLARGKRVCTPAPRPVPYRLALEPLEDRLVLDAGPPVAASITLQYQMFTSTPLNVLQFDSDPNPGNTLNPATINIVTPPQHGSAQPDPNTGLILYTPIPGGSVSDSFQYTVTDTPLGLISNVATITLQGVAPAKGGFVVADDITASTETLQPVTIDVFNAVTVNDGSAIDPTSVKILGATHSGPTFFPIPDGPPVNPVTVDPVTGLVTYTPSFGYVGYEQLVYSVKSTAGHEGRGSLFVVVSPGPPRHQADPLGGTMLMVDGTPGSDTINIFPGQQRGDVMVTINGVTSGPFQPTSRILVFGYAGNDNITVSDDIRLSAWLVAGDGNDVLVGGRGHNVLIGGAGNDTLIAGGSRDLLIGGSGRDVLVGGKSDILISGSTSFDRNQTALAAIMSEWTSDDSYRQRVDDLTDAPGDDFGDRLNGNFFLVPATIQPDNVSNVVIVGPGRSLLFVNASGPNADIVVRQHHHRFDDRQDNDDDQGDH